uniref:Mediator of RNA polymerase II transcription subunit 22 n=1 Tax=Capra hircus TaxID=9925 RepID=A0A8C2SBT6_CAPHI
MAQQRALPQSKETLLQSYNKRLKDDVKSIMDNFTEIIKTAKIEDETQVSRATQGEQDNYEMHVRAANIVRAGESLMKLVSDLKQFLILNDFPSTCTSWRRSITRPAQVYAKLTICLCAKLTGGWTRTQTPLTSPLPHWWPRPHGAHLSLPELCHPPPLQGP